MADNPLVEAYMRGRIRPQMAGFDPREPLNSGAIISTPSDSALGARGDIYPLAKYRTPDGREGIDVAWPRMLVPSPGMDRPEDGFKLALGGGLAARFGGPVQGGLGAMRGGKLNAARPEPGGGIPEAGATGPSHVLAETDTSIFPNHWFSNTPYERADETANALRQAIPGLSFEVVRSGSAAGNSAYIRTPFGDIRISDHGAHPKPGVFWQGPMDQMSPRKAVDMVSTRMQETVDKLLNGPPPNQYGSPHPNWMSADQWRAIYAANKDTSGNAAFDPAKKDSANLMAAYSGALPIPYAQDIMQDENPLVRAMRQAGG